MRELLPLEERKQIVDSILHGDGGIFLIDTPIRGIKNRIFEDSCTGYNVILGNLSYRGVWLSTIEDVQLYVDGEHIPTERLCLCLRGNIFPLYDLVNYTEIFWCLDDDCEIWVPQLGGLSTGEHTVTIDIEKRADFGHHFGNGSEGYENATEFTIPDHIHYTRVCEIQ